MFASGDNGDLVAIHPLTHFNSYYDPDNYYDPDLVTLDCDNGPLLTNCPQASDRDFKINTGTEAADDAHNNAILVYDLYFKYFGRDSLDDQGMTLLSYANADNPSDPTDCPNAYWNRGAMVYRPASKDNYHWSRAADVVAHEVRITMPLDHDSA